MEHDADVLLAQVGWIRALANTLSDDPDDAADLVQDACVAALRERPDEHRLRSWLGRVLRNLAVDRSRRTGARHVRERSVARSDRSPPTADVVERADKQRTIVEIVMGLSEPYRTTVLLRFFDGLPPRAIAKSMDAPVATVHSRLQRALQMLRERLDREAGGRRAWLAVLGVPLGGHVAATLGAFLVDTKSKFALLTVLVALFAGGMWFLVDARAPAPGAVGVPSPAQLPSARDATASSLEGSREGLADRATSMDPSPSVGAPRVRGRVLSAEGAALDGVTLRYRWGGSGVEPIVSDAGGGFEVTFSAGGVIETDDERYATLMAARLEPAGAEPIVVAAPRLSLAGRVIDTAGESVADAAITVRRPTPTVGVVLSASVPKRHRTATDARGRFELPAVPYVVGSVVFVVRVGFLPKRLALPAHSDAHLEIVLQRPSLADGRIRGVVLDADGALVPRAMVSHGSATTVADDDGQFSLPRRADDRNAALIAVARDHQPATLPPDTDWTEFLLVRLGPPPLAIQGTVVDVEGQPQSGVTVWIADPTLFGVIDRQVKFTEGLVREEQPHFWHKTETDADGRFALEGLSARSYHVRAIQKGTLVETEARDVLAGTEELSLVLPTDAVIERVAGRLFALDGEPLGGVQLTRFRQTFRYQPPNGWTASAGEMGESTVTDDQGRFTFHDVFREGVTVTAHAEAIMPLSVELSAEDLAMAEVELRAERKVHLQVELTETASADRLRVLDAVGEPMHLFLLRASRSAVLTSAPIEDGRSPVVTVGQRAAAVELFDGERRVVSIPVALSGDQVHRIRH